MPTETPVIATAVRRAPVRPGLVLKDAFDRAAALALIVLLSPVIVATALALWLSMGRPILFRQRRPGLNGRIFRLYKFRTMTNAKDAEGKLLPDSERLTRVGRLVRSLSLDELPQLYNVLTGRMSLVGPRPLLPQYLERYTPEQMRRHEMRPGVTGWAQVNGRNALDWETRFALDVWYVDHWSLPLDLKILWLTLVKVARRSGVSADGHATMPEFMGPSGTESGPVGGP